MLIFSETKSIVLIGLLALTLSSAAAKAQSPSQVVDLSKVNRQVWAANQKAGGSEIEIVQNRRYSNAGRVELQVLTGISVADPFLSVKQVGGSLGYHFNHFYSIQLLYWKYLVSPSAAADAFLTFQGTPALVDAPVSFMGAEFEGALLYGKLSLLGKSIIYIDLFVLGGAGIQKMSSGSSLAPLIGLGQRIHLNQHFALKLEYRLLRYGETIDTGSGLLRRTSMTESINLGLNYFF